MNTKNLVDAISSKTGISANMAKKVVRTTISEITSAVQSGGKVTLVGFGTFSCHDRKARLARNPRTGESVQLSASKYPKFKAGKGFKEAVNAKGTIMKKATTSKKVGVKEATTKKVAKAAPKKSVTAKAAAIANVKAAAKTAAKKVAKKLSTKAKPAVKKITRKVKAAPKKK